MFYRGSPYSVLIDSWCNNTHQQSYEMDEGFEGQTTQTQTKCSLFATALLIV